MKYLLFNGMMINDMSTKGMTTTDNDKIAMILVEAMIFGNNQAAQRNGVTVRTINKYKAQLRSGDNPDLVDKFQQKKEQYTLEWADAIPEAIMAGVDYIKRAAQQSSAKDPATIHAVAGATKLLMETQTFREFINARYGIKNTQLGEETRILDTIPSRVEE